MNVNKPTRRIYLKKQIHSRCLRRLAALLTIVTVICLTPTLPGEAATGMLDATFGSGGKVTTDISNSQDGALAMAIQPDGKIVTAGGSAISEISNFTLVRYNPDGSLDTSFGTGGKVITELGADDGANAVVLQPDGKMIAAGVSGTYSSYDFALVRYHPNGTLDTSFGTGGKVLTPIGSGNDEASAVRLQPDGKIIAAGLSGNYPNIDFALVRYNPDGTLDNSFGTGGKVLTPIGSQSDEAHAMIIQPDGKIVAAGWSDVGFGDTYFALARYNPNGTLDTSFGTGGKIITPFGSGDEIATSVAIQSNGKIIAVGWSDNSSTDFALVRYNPNGSLDDSFGTGGKVLTPIGSSTDFGFATAIQTDGKIVAAGTTYNGANFDFAVVRYNADTAAVGRAPYDFDGDSKTDISIFRPPVGEWWINHSSTGATVAAQFGLSTDKPVPADFTGDGKTDVAFWRASSGEWFILRSEDASFLSFPFGTNGDAPIVGDFDADGKADPAIFRPSTGEWFILRSTGGTIITIFGAAGDVPVPADYDGDGKADLAIYRPAAGEWWINRSSQGSIYAFQFGTSLDKPVPGDFTGDGKADSAFWRPATGEWFILRSENSSFYSVPFGTTGDVPVAGDYDGDGKFDTAVFRPSEVLWFVNRSTAGILIQAFGLNGDVPVPSAFVP